LGVGWNIWACFSSTKKISISALVVFRTCLWSYYWTSLQLRKQYQRSKQRTGKEEWMGADKNSSRRRWRLQQDEHAFQHTSPTHYPSWPSPRSHWSATGPMNQQTTFRVKTHSRTQRKLARLAACAAPVRPMVCAGQTDNTGQTDGQSRSGRWLKQPHNKCSREP
jgi:hypothetical protein